VLNFFRQLFRRNPVPGGSAPELARLNADLEHETTHRKRTEAALEHEHHLFQMLIDNLPDRIFFKDLDGRFLLNNPAHLKRLGLSSQAEARGKSDRDFFPLEHARQSREDEALVIKTGAPLHKEIKTEWPDGRTDWTLVTRLPLLDKTGKCVGTFGIARDITQNKQAADELRHIQEDLELRVQQRTEELQAANKALQIQINESTQTHDLLENSLKELNDLKAAVDEHAIVAITDPQGSITYVNDKFCAISKFSRDELLNQDHRIVNSAYHSKEFIRDLWTTIITGKIWKGEIKNKAKDGSFYWVDTTIVPFLNSRGKPHHYVAIRADITERKAAEQALKESLHDKETLLKEIHHRVKNNMQLISSLLELQGKYIQDAKALSVFQECQNRIRSMALIHEKLYQSTSLARIDFAEYARGLTNMLIRSYRLSALINVELKIETLSLNLETAVPLGLILNELITNSLEHAFSSQQAGTIHVSLLHLNDDLMCLTVRDNGVGLPPGFDLEKASTLGMRLIHILTEQLHARMEARSEQGAVITVTFQELKTKQRIETYANP